MIVLLPALARWCDGLWEFIFSVVSAFSMQAKFHFCSTSCEARPYSVVQLASNAQSSCLSLHIQQKVPLRQHWPTGLTQNGLWLLAKRIHVIVSVSDQVGFLIWLFHKDSATHYHLIWPCQSVSSSFENIDISEHNTSERELLFLSIPSQCPWT